MTIEEHKKVITSLQKYLVAGNVTENAAAFTDALNLLLDDYNKVSMEHQVAATKADKLMQDNESLRAANMRLFVQVNDLDSSLLKTGKDINNPKAEDKADEEKDKPIPFESLFDENGILKGLQPAKA